MPGITVGIDGSDQSKRALEWAIKEAAIRNTPLTVLAVHQVAGNHWTGDPEIYPADQPEAEKARQAAQELVQKTIDASGGSGPSVTVRAVSGIAAQELIKASNDSDLVVVGARGGGGFARLWLGSTANQVVNHAAAPVVVIPSGR
jgi:nucleotide-binding universal stress UspA family protein